MEGKSTWPDVEAEWPIIGDSLKPELARITGLEDVRGCEKLLVELGSMAGIVSLIMLTIETVAGRVFSLLSMELEKIKEVVEAPSVDIIGRADGEPALKVVIKTMGWLSSEVDEGSPATAEMAGALSFDVIVGPFCGEV